MKNLYLETCEAISGPGKRPEDIAFIGSGDGEWGCTWAEYATIADIEYDNGFGGAEVAEDLVIVFRDGSWLERGEYDGSEWWSYKAAPQIPSTYKAIRRLTGDGLWDTVAGLNREFEEQE